MSEDVKIDQQPALGKVLRDTRESLNLSLEDAQKTTKLSLSILKYIESDDFDNMPAEAFCRGFYVMYAKYLKLDPDEILARYIESRKLSSSDTIKRSRPPISNSAQFSNYAEPSSVPYRTGWLATTMICLVALVAVVWYFDFNPADILDKGMNSSAQEEKNFQPQEAVKVNNHATKQEQYSQGGKKPEADITTSATAVVEAGSRVQLTTQPYTLSLTPRNSGILTVTIDDGFFADKPYDADQTLQWKVERSIILDMPAAIDAVLRLNGVDVPMPDPVNGRRLLSLPEDLLN